MSINDEDLIENMVDLINLNPKSIEKGTYPGTPNPNSELLDIKMNTYPGTSNPNSELHDVKMNTYPGTPKPNSELLDVKMNTYPGTPKPNSELHDVKMNTYPGTSSQTSGSIETSKSIEMKTFPGTPKPNSELLDVKMNTYPGTPKPNLNDIIYKKIEEIEELIKNNENIDVISIEIKNLKELIKKENPEQIDTLLKSIEEILKTENKDEILNKISELKEIIKPENEDLTSILSGIIDEDLDEEGFGNISDTYGLSSPSTELTSASFSVDFALLEQAIKILGNSKSETLKTDSYDSLKELLNIINDTPVKTKTSIQNLKSTVLDCLGMDGKNNYIDELKNKLIKLQNDCKEKFPDYELMKNYSEYMSLEAISQLNEWDSEEFKNRSEVLESELKEQISNKKTNINDNKEIENLNLDLIIEDIKLKKSKIEEYYDAFSYKEKTEDTFDYLESRNNNLSSPIDGEIENFIDSEIKRLTDLNESRSSNSTITQTNDYSYKTYSFLTDEELELLMIYSGYKFSSSSNQLSKITDKIKELEISKSEINETLNNKSSTLRLRNDGLPWIEDKESYEETENEIKGLENDIANCENKINNLNKEIENINEQSFYPAQNNYYKYGEIYYNANVDSMLRNRNRNKKFTDEENDLLIQRSSFVYSCRQNECNNEIRENQSQINKLSERKEELDKVKKKTQSEESEYQKIVDEIAGLNEKNAVAYETYTDYEDLKFLLAKHNSDFKKYCNLDNYSIVSSEHNDEYGTYYVNDVIVDSNGNICTDLTDEEKAIIYLSKGVKSVSNSKINEYIEYLSQSDNDYLDVLVYNFNKSKQFQGYDFEFSKSFDYWYDRGAQILGHEKADKLTNYLENHTADWLTLGAVGTWDGVCNFFDGLGNLFDADGKRDADDYKSMFVSEYIKTSENYNDLYSTILNADYEIMNSIGNMLPSIALSIVCTPLGTISMGLSAAGNAREQALQDGMSEGAAWVYGILSGASEAVLERFLGGIPGLSNMSNTIGTHGLVKLFKAGMGEATEEMLQEVLDPIFKLMTTGEWEGVDPQAVLKAGIYAFITAGIMNGGSVTFEGISYTLTGDYATLSTLANAHLFDESHKIKNFLTDLKYIQSCDVTGLKSSLSNSSSVRASFEQYQKLHPKEEIDFNDYISGITINSLLNINPENRTNINLDEIIKNGEGLSKLGLLQSLNDMLNNNKLKSVELRENISALSIDTIVEYITLNPSIENVSKLINNLTEEQIGNLKNKNPNLVSRILNANEANRSETNSSDLQSRTSTIAETLNRYDLTFEEVSQLKDLIKMGINTTMEKSFVEELLKLDSLPHQLKSILNNMLAEMGDNSSLRLQHKSTLNKINQYLDEYFNNYEQELKGKQDEAIIEFREDTTRDIKPAEDIVETERVSNPETERILREISNEQIAIDYLQELLNKNLEQAKEYKVDIEGAREVLGQLQRRLAEEQAKENPDQRSISELQKAIESATIAYNTLETISQYQDVIKNKQDKINELQQELDTMNNVENNTGQQQEETSTPTRRLDEVILETSQHNKTSLKEKLLIKISEDISNMKKATSDIERSKHQLEIARYLYFELGKKVDYSTAFKYAMKNNNETMYNELYNKQMDLTALEKNNSIICVNWAQIYSEILIDAGFREDQIVIQRVTDNNGNYIRGSHAAIYIVLDDGSIIIPDLTAPLGKNADFYNVKVGNKTSGFIYFTSEQVQEITKLGVQFELDYNLNNLGLNNTSANIESGIEKFLDIAGRYMFGMEIDASKHINAKELKKSRIKAESEFYNKYKSLNEDIIDSIDGDINSKLTDSDFFIEKVTEEFKEEAKINDIEYLKERIITTSFLSVDNINSSNMLNLYAYLKETATREGLFYDGSSTGIKIKFESPKFISENETEITMHIYENGVLTGESYIYYLDENNKINVRKL